MSRSSSWSPLNQALFVSLQSYNEINSSASVAPTYISEDGDEDISGFDDSRPEPLLPLVPPHTSSPSTMQPLCPFYTSPASPMQVDLPSRQTTPSMPCDASPSIPHDITPSLPNNSPSAPGVTNHVVPKTPPPSTKRKLDAQKSLSKSPEVEKKQSKKAIASSTQRALGGNVRLGSVLQYFRKVTKEEHNNDLEREAERDAVGKEARQMAEVQQTARNCTIKLSRRAKEPEDCVGRT